MSALLPDRVASLRLDVPGGPLAAVVAEPPDHLAGRVPVLLVPGFTGSKEDFRLVLEPLARAGHRAVALDQRGQYESVGPEDPAAYGVPALASDLLDVLALLGPVHLVGHSFGGLVSRAAVLRSPGAVRSLTLMSSGPAGLTGPRTEVLPYLRPLLQSGGLPAVADAVAALEATNPPPVPVAPELREFLRRRFLAGSAAGLQGMADALLDEPDRVEELRDSGVPVLVLHGEHDDAWPPALQHTMAQRLSSAYAVVSGTRHSPAVEDPGATVRELVAFFAAVEG